MGVKRQRGGAGRRDCVDEALQAASRHKGAATPLEPRPARAGRPEGEDGEGGTGAVSNEESQAPTAWHRERRRPHCCLA
jgi:hypothetical protein